MIDNPVIGFVGLGSIGAPMAAQIVGAGFRVLGYDVASRDLWAKVPTEAVESINDVAQGADLILLSLPDTKAANAVIGQLRAASGSRVRRVADLSTIGVQAARQFDTDLAAVGISYADCPVSGGVSGARAGKLSTMCAASDESFAELKPVLEAFSARVFHVGKVAGQGQALKLLNNFLSATALAATSEAVAFGLANGLDMTTMLDVLKVSSGRNSAVDDKFPNQIANERYDAGFRAKLMSKDVDLYLADARNAERDGPVAHLVTDIWQQYQAAAPDEDFTAVFRFISSNLSDRPPV